MSEGDPREFADLLRGYAAAQERAAAASAPEPAAEVLHLAARVRRRRLVRTGSVVTGAIAAALVGAVAVYGVTRPDPIVPAPPPTESETAEPAPSPTASDEPTAQPTRDPGEPDGVTRHALLPDVEPMTNDLWAQTDADWMLGRYTATKDEADGSSMESPTVLYLLAPDGTAYEVTVPEVLLPTDATMSDWQLTDWRPGDSRAVFRAPEMPGDGGDSMAPLLVIDLATGEELVSYPAWDNVVLLPGDRTLVVRSDGSLTVAQIHDRDGYHLQEIGPFDRPPYVEGWPGSRGWAVDPTRTQLLLETPDGTSVFDLADVKQLEMPPIPAPAQAPCQPVSWLEHNRLVVRCAELQDVGGQQEVGSYLWIANLGDGSTRRLTAAETQDDSVVAEAWQVGENVVVNLMHSAPLCGQEIAVVAGDGAQNVVPGTESLLVRGVRGGLLIGETYSCDAGQYRGLVSLDVATGRVSLVLPRVEGATAYFTMGSGLSQMTGVFGTWW